MQKLLSFLFITVVFYSCKQKNSIPFNSSMQTFSNFENVTTKHLDWCAKIEFENKKIIGVATWHFTNKLHAKNIVFDTYDLNIKKVTINQQEIKYSLIKIDSLTQNFGIGLQIPINENDTIVSIEYETGNNATALQWLEAQQTAGKKMPYLFTQCESIHARSLIPCQDVPANRITYNASIETPIGMMAVMSAKNPTQKNEKGIYSFEMEIPIPTYLIALAVGDIEYKAIDYRSGVYTEPSLLQKAYNELTDIPNMIAVAEKLGGKYPWGKYDVLIAPPSFPIGGMENPRLTFATPTIIAGDKSLVSLIAHELAHSWSGNLVTNATWNDLWLNEGFTTYFERRIMEEIAGKDYTEMLWKIGMQDMESDFESFGKTNPDTKLRIELGNRHPEESFSNIPYEKGAIFLRMLEENCGRTKFDAFMNNYFQTHKFQTITTEKCIAFMHKHLFDNNTQQEENLKLKQWIYEAGLPNNAPLINPIRFMKVDTQRIAFEKTGNIQELKTSHWSTHEWLHFLRKLPHPFLVDKMNMLDNSFHLTHTYNSEIACEWFLLSINSGYENAFKNLEHFLSNVGRKKFLAPLYSEMKKKKEYISMAKTIFTKYKNNYHPQTAKRIEEILK